MSCDFLALHPPKMHRNSEISLTGSSSKSEDLLGRLGPLLHIHLTSKGQPNRVVIAIKRYTHMVLLKSGMLHTVVTTDTFNLF